MNKLILAAVAAVTLALGGCGPGVESVSQSEFDTSKLSFFFEPRSETCYAALKTSKGRADWFGVDDRVIFAGVPCTDKVLALAGGSIKPKQ